MTETLEHTARRIAERGREELVARLRPAYQEAASAHADVLELDADQLEQMVQSAVDRADGLQWRRALAAVASDELGIGLGEALAHPAVARAQTLVGAPAYEDGLMPSGTPTVVDARRRGAADEAPAPEPAARAVAEPVEPPTPEPSVAATEPPAPEPEAPPEPEPKQHPRAESPTVADLRIPVIHLGGIANLRPAESGLELRLSDEGLDITRGRAEILGRLAWTEIRSLDVPFGRSWLPWRRATHLVVRTAHGDASFEIPALTPEELHEELAPMVRRHRVGQASA